ncbi:MAG: heme o synthase [Candidatus Thermoplasmatota archaeon]|nr:heme o synthase [Candidatus Thermoplasmatota archaeon]MCL5889321.1 heme o synthase [Candidatus Thermoplasmatota archaeon]
MKAAGRIMIYLKYTKPKVWILLVFIGGIGAVIAAGSNLLLQLPLILLAILTLVAGTAGSEAITNYIDRDIDSRMKRTAGRPLVTGKVTKKEALILGFALITLAIAPLVFFERYYAACFMIAGILDNVVVYSFLLKRKTPWSIIFGGFSGGFPVVIGWYTVTNAFSITPWALFFLVVIWIPIHIWSIAFLYKEDYSNAGVPMLPVVYSEETSARAIAFSAFFLSVFSILLCFIERHPVVYLFSAIILASPLIYFSYRFMKIPDKKASLALFKYSNMFLAMLFAIFAIMAFF